MDRYYAYIRVPSSTFRDEIIAFEREYQGSSRSEPHITLWRPSILISECDESKLIATLSEAVNGYGPFLVSTKRVGYFNGKQNVHYCIELSPELKLLYKKLNATATTISRETGSFVGKHFHPHITLAQRIQPEQGKKLYQLAKRAFVPYEFMCTEIWLMRIESGQPKWQKVASLPL